MTALTVRFNDSRRRARLLCAFLSILLFVGSSSRGTTITYRATSRGANAAEYAYQYGIARFYVSGSLIWSATGGGGGGRGINVATFTSTGAQLYPPRNWDTWGDAAAIRDLIAFLNGLPSGTVVLIAVADDAGINVWNSCTIPSASELLVQTLESLGSRQIRGYCYHASFAMLSVKGEGTARVEQLQQSSEAAVEVSVTQGTTAPMVAITTPTSGSTFTTNSGMINLAGVASAPAGVTRVSWSNNRGGSGVASGTTNWTASAIPLQVGVNILTVTASDAVGSSSSTSLSVTYTSPWLLTFSEDFDTSALDPNKWIYDTGVGPDPSNIGWGNHEQETYTNRPQNVSVSGGLLFVTARQETFTGSDGVTRNYTSGRILTQGKFTQAYGRVECRMKLPTGQGMWPACWMLGDDFSIVGWPAAGEIDVAENVGRETSTVHGTLHGPGYSGANGIGGTFSLPNGQRFADAFHVFAIEWEPNVIRWYVDDQLYKTVNRSDLPSGAVWAFEHPFYILLNLAVGGDFPGNPDSSTQFPQSLLVDYVRVYRRDPPLTDVSAPIVRINTPASGSANAMNTSTATLSGTTSDDLGVVSVSYTNTRGGSGVAIGTKNWAANGISLQPGVNIITFTARDAAGKTGTAMISVNSTLPDTTAPFGSFDTPLSNTSGVVGAIPITGWTLRKNGSISKVEIYREPTVNEAQGNLVFIGTATFVSGARPDVQAAYPNYPDSNRAGWGYMLLTNGLPNNGGSPGSGNGTYRLHMFAFDAAGNYTELGAPGRTITCDNAHAARPFGTIDTPGQGGTASGSDFIVFGWALTQNPYVIPFDGSTITVMVDGLPRSGHPTYNQYRVDIANAFPGLANSNGAVAYYHLDTTKLTNGVHTIGLLVYDNAGRGEGLGSRFFTVTNGIPSAVPDPSNIESMVGRGLMLGRGFDLNHSVEPLLHDEHGVYSINLEELGRIELHAGVTGGFSLVNGVRQELPIGSILKGGVFYWQLGPGFLGDHELMLERPNEPPVRLRVRIHPKVFSTQVRPTQ